MKVIPVGHFSFVELEDHPFRAVGGEDIQKLFSNGKEYWGIDCEQKRIFVKKVEIDETYPAHAINDLFLYLGFIINTLEAAHIKVYGEMYFVLGKAYWPSVYKFYTTEYSNKLVMAPMKIDRGKESVFG